MGTLEITLISISAVLIVLGFLFAILWYIALPKFLVKKLREGKEVTDNPINFEEIASNVNIEKDCVYDTTYPNCEYDVYTNKNGISNGTIIWVHGGFFIAGSKNGVSNLSTCIAAHGYTVIAINYALAPEYKYPSQLKQLDDAINYVMSKRLDIDSSRIILAGDSAGGQIVSQYVTLVNSNKMQEDLGFYPSISPKKISALILVSAPIDVGMLYGHIRQLDILLPTFGRVFYGNGKWFNNKAFASSHTYNYLINTLPPTFITDGNNVSFEVQNRKLGEELRNLNVPVTEVYFDREKLGEVNHEYLFCLSTNAAQIGLKALLDFLDGLV